MSFINQNKRDFKYEQSKRYSHEDRSTFNVLVTAVDNNETIDDMQEKGRTSWLGEDTDRRSLYISGIRLDQGVIVNNIAVPQAFSGQVYMPCVGDTVKCKVNSIGAAGEISVVQVMYSGRDRAQTGESVVPMWLSMPNDYGHLRSHQDHGMQFASKPDKHDLKNIPKNAASFATKWVRSITGERWRKTLYEDHEISANKFVTRGDNVFDIDPKSMSLVTIEEQGMSIMPVGSQAEYPEPNNTPFKREKRDDFVYIYKKHTWLKAAPKFKVTDTGGDAVIQPSEFIEYTMQTKYQFSYEPISDKKYRTKTSGKNSKGFERELPAVEEYQVALKGNNKLLIQDIKGDGEQILITLKTQYDEGITFIHDRERSQVRIRDHIGNSVLLEGDRDKPRIVLKTSEKQVMEMGSVKGKGQFLYMRNGPVHTDSELSWGRKPGTILDAVFNQEFFMGDSEAILSDPEVTGRVSSGLAGLFAGPGIYMRSEDDSTGKYEKTYANYESGGTLYEKTMQKWKSTNTYLKSETKVDAGDHSWFVEGNTQGKTYNLIKIDTDHMILARPQDKTSIFLDKTTVDVDSDVDINLRTKKNLQLEGENIVLQGNSVAVNKGAPSAVPRVEKG